MQLTVADKYDVPALVRFCQNGLIKKISSENAVNFFRAGYELPTAEDLKIAAMEYIRTNHDAVASGLLTLNPDQLLEIVKYVCTCTNALKQAPRTPRVPWNRTGVPPNLS